MAVDEVLHLGDTRLRIGRWQGDNRVAQLVPLPGRSRLTAESVRATMSTIERRGFIGAITAALAPGEQAPFLTAGFGIREHLHLLAHDLQGLDPARSPVRMRRARRRDEPQILDVDHAAFPDFWQLDQRGLRDAAAATPSDRSRVAEDRGEVVGYAISGRAGTLGYLQRLAVRPDAAGRGIGRALVVDGLHWMRRRGAGRALVNTQAQNERALDLYLRLGFRHEPHGLAVLEWRR